MFVNKVVGTTLSIEGTNALSEKVLEAQETGVTSWHIDVCRKKFAPSEAGIPTFMREFCRLSLKQIDVHLMTQCPTFYFSLITDLSIPLCTPHIEANFSTTTLDFMKKRQFSPGLAVKLDTSLSRVVPFLPSIDRVLLLCGDLGIAGQGFDDQSLKRIQRLADIRQARALNFRIGVDGGIYPRTAKLCAEAGANDFCCGSWIFHGSRGPEPRDTGSIANRVEQMLEAIQQ